MKTKNIIMSVVFLGIVSTGVYAVTANKSSQQSNLTKKNQEIHLYTSASTSSKVIQDYPLTKSFVVISFVEIPGSSAPAIVFGASLLT